MKTLTEVLLALATFYATVHPLLSLIAPLLPAPATLGNKWYPAVYAAIQWIALGNGPKTSEKVETLERKP